ncbi:MAG: alpha/beta hydrolase fold protein [Ilumatobacteraceae bacterium]|nr:alpha/beta hydrolase fold protein [Ilumatobacteraceae bacterium]
MEIHNGDLALNVVVDGDAASPPVLLLHGITGSVRAWDWLVPHLVDRHRVIRLDFRGHGRSGRAPGDYHLPGYLDDAVATCRQAAAVPCVVIGHSLGGVTAAALAQQHPDLLRGALLEDPPLGASGELEGNPLMDGFRLMRESIPRLQAGGIPAPVLADVLAGTPSATGPTFGELLHPDALLAMAEGLLELDASVLDPVIDGSIRPAFDPTRPITVPTLVITADPASPDAAARPADVERLTATSPQAKARVVQGAGHLIHDELAHRDEFLAEVLGFLARLA